LVSELAVRLECAEIFGLAWSPDERTVIGNLNDQCDYAPRGLGVWEVAADVWFHAPESSNPGAPPGRANCLPRLAAERDEYLARQEFDDRPGIAALLAGGFEPPAG
jgi:hypothetical protein